jgi:hypothetical protein
MLRCAMCAPVTHEKTVDVRRRRWSEVSSVLALSTGLAFSAADRSASSTEPHLIESGCPRAAQVVSPSSFSYITQPSTGAIPARS